MATAAEYRKLAEECFEWAREARDESVRQHYAKLGQIWLESAARAAFRSRVIRSSEPKTAQKVA
jgi:predicted oxidoreductase